MLIYHRYQVEVDHVADKQQQVGVHTAFALGKGVEAIDEHSLGVNGFDGLSRAGGMAADEVVLQIEPLGIGNAMLRHRPEAGVDAIDHLVLRKIADEIEISFRALQCSLADIHLLLPKKN